MFKKLTVFFASALLACSTLAISSSASKEYLVDDADVFSSSKQREYVEDELERISDEYDVDVVIVTVDTTNGKSSMEFADDYFDYNGYGRGSDHDGVILLLAVEDREYWISTCGSCIQTFTDRGIEYIGDELESDFGADNFSKGLEEFVNQSEIFLEQDRNGEPFDVGNMPLTTSDILTFLVISFVISMIIALIVTSSMKGQLKSVKMQASAQNYIRRDSFALAQSSDVFVNRSVSRTVRQTSSGGGGGGGSSTHRSSSGRSHGGGGGRF